MTEIYFLTVLKAGKSKIILWKSLVLVNTLFMQLSNCKCGRVREGERESTSSLVPLIRTLRACAKSFQLCLTLCDVMDYNPPGSSAHRDSPGKTTGVVCHALLTKTPVLLYQDLTL